MSAGLLGLSALAAMAFVASLVAFVQMGTDKRRAKEGRHRISEARLLAPVLFGGAPGLWWGMKVHRHKTIKGSFKLKFAGHTAIYALWAVLVCWWCMKLV